MHTQWIAFAAILLVNTAGALLIAILLIRRPPAPGERALTAMLLLLAVWSFGYAMITLLPDLESKLFWLKFENIGILTVPVVWFLFTVQYTRLDRWLNSYTGSLLFLIPAISLVILFSERWFHFYYSALRPISEDGGPLVIGRGSWYLVALVNSYIFNLKAALETPVGNLEPLNRCGAAPAREPPLAANDQLARSADELDTF